MTLRDRVVEWLRALGRPATVTDVREGLGMSRTTERKRTVSTTLYRLERDGLVRRVRAGGPRAEGWWESTGARTGRTT